MKLAIITGGSRGLGRSLYKNLSSSGWTTYDLSRSGDFEKSINIDLENSKEALEICENLFNALKDKPYSDILYINNAASISPIKKLSNCSNNDIETHIQINITSPLLILKSFIRCFGSTSCKKHIVHISSGAALHGRAGWSLYTLSKAGMDNLINSLALEQKSSPNPFIAISIDPGVMDTDMQEEIRGSSTSEMPDLARFMDLKKEGTLASPDNVAQKIIRILDVAINGKRYSVNELS